MIIGAYPSARFEYRKAKNPVGKNPYRLIPVADNLQPFGDEEYFDGLKVRKLESTVGLKKYLLDPLGLKPKNCWITDLVKVFLYKKEHMDSCKPVLPNFKVPVLRDRFHELGERNLDWILEEIQLCKPGVIVTLGLEVAQVVGGKKSAKPDDILKSNVSNPENLNGVSTVYAPIQMLVGGLKSGEM